tara:strand:+ start:2508 stop:3137 length:630 start_codon:yes stop_codon:yes gene_type:complete
MPRTNRKPSRTRSRSRSSSRRRISKKSSRKSSRKRSRSKSMSKSIKINRSILKIIPNEVCRKKMEFDNKVFNFYEKLSIYILNEITKKSGKGKLTLTDIKKNSKKVIGGHINDYMYNSVINNSNKYFVTNNFYSPKSLEKILDEMINFNDNNYSKKIMLNLSEIILYLLGEITELVCLSANKSSKITLSLVKERIKGDEELNRIFVNFL